MESLADGRKFTPDGHLVGSLGEALAASKYSLSLLPSSAPVHDAVSADGRQVQIKTTQGDSVSTYPEQPEHLLVVKLLQSGEIEEWFNGPGAVAWRLLGKTAKNGQCRLPLKRLRALMDEVPDEERLEGAAP